MFEFLYCLLLVVVQVLFFLFTYLYIVYFLNNENMETKKPIFTWAIFVYIPIISAWIMND